MRELLELSLPALNAMLALSALFSMGLDVSVDRLLGALRHRLDLSWGLFCNFLAVPGFALLACTVMQIEPALTLGIMLCALTPGGGVGTLLTDRAGGDVSISVTLMILCALLSILMTPLLIGWSAGQLAVDVSGNLYLQLFLVFLCFQLLPLFAGMLVRHRQPERAQRWKPVIAKIAFALLIGITAAYIWLRGAVLGEGLHVLFTATVISLFAYGLPMCWRYRAEGARRAYMLTTGVRNLALSLVLVSTVFAGQDEVLFGLLGYGLMMFLVGIPCAEYLRARPVTAPADGARPPDA